MLIKLFKYEMKSLGRILLPLYGAVLLLTLALSAIIAFAIENVYVNMLLGTIYTLIFAVSIIMTLFLIVQRFYKNLLGSEGYLMFTLPVSTRQHLISKALSSGLFCVLGCFVGFLSIFLLSWSAGSFDSSTEWLPIMKETFSILFEDDDIRNAAIILILTVFVGMFANIFRIYAALSIGHAFNSRKIAWSATFYIGLTFVEAQFINIVSRIDLSWIEASHHQTQLALILLGYTVVQLAIYSFVSHYFLKNKLNLQ